MTDEDLELASDWSGEPGKLIPLLVEVGFLDGQSGEFHVHDWAQHNPWAAGANERSESSKWAALCKRYGKEGAAARMPDYATRMRPACAPDADAVRRACPVTVSVTVSDSNKPPKSPKGDEHERFAEFWKVYPSRGKAANPRKTAAKAFAAAVKRGADPEILIRYAPQASPPDKHGSEFVPQAATWLNQDRWRDVAGEGDLRTGGPPGLAGEALLEWWITQGGEDEGKFRVKN